MSGKPSDNDSILLMNHDRVLRTVERMAYQIDEDHQRDRNMLVVGIKERGWIVADSVADILENRMDTTVFRAHLPEQAEELDEVTDKTEFPNYFDYALVVDDVIFSGHTMLHSLDIVRRTYEMNVLRTAVLVDRGHRQVPVEASFCGVEIPTKLDEHVQVCLDGQSLKNVILTTKDGWHG